MKLSFLNRFLKNPKVSNFFKICPVGDDVFHANGQTDRRTDMTKLIVAFRFFTSAPIKFSQDIRYPGRKSNHSFLEYDSGALLLHHHAQYLLELFPDITNLINRIMK